MNWWGRLLAFVFNKVELAGILAELKAIRAELQLIRALLEPTGELRRYGPLEPLQPLGRTKQ